MEWEFQRLGSIQTIIMKIIRSIKDMVKRKGILYAMTVIFVGTVILLWANIGWVFICIGRWMRNIVGAGDWK